MKSFLENKNFPLTLKLKVIPKAKVQQIKKETLENGEVIYKVYVNSPPENGKANKAVISLLQKELGISKSRIHIVRGETSREKTLQIEA